MATGFSRSNLANAMREIFTQDRIHDLTKPVSPLLAMLPRKENWDGGTSTTGLIHTVLDISKAQTVSATFSTSQSLAGSKSNTLVEFQTPTKKKYALTRIEREMLQRAKMASGKNRGAIAGVLMEVAEMKYKSALKAFAETLCTDLYGDSSGAIGRVATSGVSTTSLTLTNPEDAHHFEVGMVLQASDTKTGGSLRDSGNTAVVTGVNYDTGVLTSSSNWTAQISGLTDADYLYRSGDYDAAVHGLAAWLPPAGASGTFLNVNRTAHPQRLGGVAVDATGKSVAQAIVEAVVKSNKYGGRNHTVFLNPTDYITLLDQLGAQATYETLRPTANVSFDSVVVRGGPSPVKVVSDPFCPVTFAWGLDLDPEKIVLVSVGSFPHIFDDDDGSVHTITDDDGLECRVGGYGNLVACQPGAHFVIRNIGS